MSFLTANRLFQHLPPYKFIEGLFDGTELEINDFISGEKAFHILSRGRLYLAVWFIVQVLYENGNDNIRVQDIQDCLHEKLNLDMNGRTVLQRLQELEQDGIVEANRFPKCSQFKLKYTLFIRTEKC